MTRRSQGVIWVPIDVDGGRGRSYLALLVVGVLLVLASLAHMPVTVPVLWPLGATAAAVWLGLWGLRWRLRYRRAQRAELRQEQGAAPSAVTAPTGLGYGSSVRIGDAERDQVCEALAQHHAAGRLTAEEVTERVAAVLAARTLPDLEDAVRDLPELGWWSR